MNNKKTGKGIEKTISSLFFISAVLSLVIGNAVVLEAQCSSIHTQWCHSAHAGSMDNAGEKERMNKTGCAHCHTAQGYHEVILEGKKSSTPYKNPVGLKCIACHPTTPEGKPDGSRLIAGNVKSSCRCHDVLVQNDIEDFSHCPQGSIVRGEGGKEFSNKRYKTGTHSEIEKNCAGCHMAINRDANASLFIGGHTFRVISKRDSPRRFNPSGCIACHDDITYDFVKQSQAKTKKLLDTLANLLPQKPKRSSNRPDEGPRLPADPVLTKVQAMASYNYYTVLRDGTYGVHNPVYIRQLLEHSIEALRGDQKNQNKKR